MNHGIDNLKQGDSVDPTRAAGPYATPLVKEINTRIAIKRQLLGETTYRELVRQRVQESVQALVRQHWSDVAHGVEQIKETKRRRKARRRHRRGDTLTTDDGIFPPLDQAFGLFRRRIVPVGAEDTDDVTGVSGGAQTPVVAGSSGVESSSTGYSTDETEDLPTTSRAPPN
jgi:hypothetical protein